MEETTRADELIMSLVEQALTRPAEERRAFLLGACEADAELFELAWKYVQSEELMGSFLTNPLYRLEEKAFEPGELLLNRFRIVREIARGGMGIVWEAMDEKLERRVAIKCAKAGFSQQLPPEVRNAREISHPNVCKLYEIHTTPGAYGDIDFISMEFVEGEPLSERLKNGPLGKKECLQIALQLCAGLSEAHRNQVIHGDLKSNNVILSQNSDGSVRAVIMDFGLASKRGVTEEGRRPGPAGGTPAYMAPELWQGAKPSVASDIYAFGMILWEMAAGLRPHAGNVSQSTLPLGTQVAQEHPSGFGKWDRVVAGCLEAEPDRRYRNPDEIARALAPPHTRRWWLAAAAVLLAAISGRVTYVAVNRPPEAVRLAVLPLQPGAISPAESERLTNEIIAGAYRLKSNQHTSVEVVPLQAVHRSHVSSVDDAGRLTNATHVLHADVIKTKDQLIVHGFLTDARSRVNVKEWTASYSEAETRYVPAFLTSLVTSALHLPIESEGKVNAAARSDYMAGIHYLRRDTTVPLAVASFERATQADRSSSPAFAGLAEAQWFEYFLTKQSIWLERSTETLGQAQRRDMDLAQVHRVAGLHLRKKGFYEQAAAEYHRAIELEPKDAENYRRIGQVYEGNNQKEEALNAFQTAIALQPDYYRAYLELGAYHFNRAEYSEAEAPLQKAVELAPAEPSLRFALGSTDMDLGKYGEAEEQLRAAVTHSEDANALHSLGLVLMYEGRDKESIGYFLRALKRNPQNFLSWMYAGIAYRRTGQMAPCKEANRRGLEIAEVELGRNPRDGYQRAILGYFAAALHDRARAESETAQALMLAPDDAETIWVAILSYEALGKRDESLGILLHCSRQQAMDISRWPDLADLHQDPRFLQLLANLNGK